MAIFKPTMVDTSGNIVSSLKKSFLSSSSIFKNSFCTCVFHDLCKDLNIRKNPLFSRIILGKNAGIISLFSLDSGYSADRFRVDGEEYQRMPAVRNQMILWALMKCPVSYYLYIIYEKIHNTKSP